MFYRGPDSTVWYTEDYGGKTTRSSISIWTCAPSKSTARCTNTASPPRTAAATRKIPPNRTEAFGARRPAEEPPKHSSGSATPNALTPLQLLDRVMMSLSELSSVE